MGTPSKQDNTLTPLTNNRVAPKKGLRAPQRDESKSRTTLCIPKGMLTAAHTAMQNSGFSLKRRSQWIEEAVEQFLSMPGFIDLVMEEFIEPGGNTTIPVTLRSSLTSRIDTEIESIRATGNFTIERSGVLRTAISQAILRQRGRAHAG